MAKQRRGGPLRIAADRPLRKGVQKGAQGCGDEPPELECGSSADLQAGGRE